MSMHRVLRQCFLLGPGLQFIGWYHPHLKWVFPPQLTNLDNLSQTYPGISFHGSSKLQQVDDINCNVLTFIFFLYISTTWFVGSLWVILLTPNNAFSSSDQLLLSQLSLIVLFSHSAICDPTHLSPGTCSVQLLNPPPPLSASAGFFFFFPLLAFYIHSCFQNSKRQPTLWV